MNLTHGLVHLLATIIIIGIIMIEQLHKCAGDSNLFYFVANNVLKFLRRSEAQMSNIASNLKRT